MMYIITQIAVPITPNFVFVLTKFGKPGKQEEEKEDDDENEDDTGAESFALKTSTKHSMNHELVRK